MGRNAAIPRQIEFYCEISFCRFGGRMRGGIPFERKIGRSGLCPGPGPAPMWRTPSALTPTAAPAVTRAEPPAPYAPGPRRPSGGPRPSRRHFEAVPRTPAGSALIRIEISVLRVRQYHEGTKACAEKLRPESTK